MVGFDLKELALYFPIISQRDLGGPKMKKIEDLFAPLKSGSIEFGLQHIRIIRDEDKKYWRFLDWWRMPEISEADIVDLKHAFCGLRGFNEDLVMKLFDLLKNIEIVSCILRFVSPEDYAIFSTPVEDLLNIKGRTPVQKYMAYLSDLRELKGLYRFTRIADVDMALWTLARILNSTSLKTEPPYDEIYENYRREPNTVKRIMARNALEQIWGEKKYIHIADLFLETDYVVAGILAGRELECQIKKKCEANHIDISHINGWNNEEYVSLKKLVRGLFDNGLISREEKRQIFSWWGIRSRLVHEESPRVGEAKVRWMIEGIIDFLRNGL